MTIPSDAQIGIEAPVYINHLFREDGFMATDAPTREQGLRRGISLEYLTIASNGKQQDEVLHFLQKRRFLDGDRTV